MEMLQKYISLDNISNNIANEVVDIYRGDKQSFDIYKDRPTPALKK